MNAPHFRPWPPLIPVEQLVRGPLLVLSPHPDDETIGCGGTILAHRDRGVEVSVVFLTDGHLGDPGVRQGAEYVERRRAEARRALELLGGARARFLDFKDGSLAAHVEALAAALGPIFAQEAATTLLLPSPFEIHSDHRATAIAAALALQGLGNPPRILGYQIGGPMPANLLVDMTSRMARKEVALAAYSSQLEHQDLIDKLRAVSKSHTVNVPMPEVQWAEAFLEVQPAQAADYLLLVDQLLRMGDGMVQLS